MSDGLRGAFKTIITELNKEIVEVDEKAAVEQKEATD